MRNEDRNIINIIKKWIKIDIDKKKSGLLIAAGMTVFTAVLLMRPGQRNRQEAEQAAIHKKGFYERNIKRPLDVLLAGTALVVFSPVIGITAGLVKLKLGAPILFVQERPGLHEEIFTMYKFRTMTNRQGNDGKLLPDEERLTAFGRMLRKTSLDELPELVNILKGDMSIVGPRPLLVEYLPRYNERQKHRHDVRPGLTGLAQVSGRNRLSWEEKFEDDVEYAKKVTFLGDLRILLKTVAVVLGRSGISSATSATMEAFMGNEE